MPIENAKIVVYNKISGYPQKYMEGNFYGCRQIEKYRFNRSQWRG